MDWDNKIVQMLEAIARIETKLDSVINLENRVDCLEKDKAWLNGAYWVLVALFGLVVALIKVMK